MIKMRGGPSAGMPKIRIAPAPPPPSALSIEQQKKVRDWQVIWPAYIDHSKTREQGRCIPKSKAATAPTLREIVDALVSLGFDAVAEENKRYPRDTLEYGRVRFLLKKEHVPVHPELHSKHAVCKSIGEIIRKHPSRARAASSNAPVPVAPVVKGKKGKGAR